MSKFKEYNNYLIEYNSNIGLITYIIDMHKIYKKNIDMTIIKYYCSINEKKFIIDHTELSFYDIQYNDIKEYLDNNDLKNNEDYHVGVLNDKITYYLTPKSFKICLLNSEHSLKYIKYYIFLDECNTNYNKYLLDLKDKAFSLKDEKLCYLNKRLNEFIRYINKLKSENRFKVNNINIINNEIKNMDKLKNDIVHTKM